MYLHLICEPVETSAYWVMDMVNGIVRESIKKGLTLVTSGDGLMQDGVLSESMASERRMALVAGYSLFWIDEILHTLITQDIEPILVSVYPHTFPYRYSSVSFNTEEAMRNLITVLAESGKSRIAFFALHKDTVGDLAKLRGYTGGMHSNGLFYEPSDIYIRRKAVDCGKQLLESIHRYDTIVCTNDLLAIWLIRYLGTHGVIIPDDVEITGFGNWSTVDYFSPKLTRVYTDLEELGCQAVRLHQYMQYNPKIDHCTSMLECSLQPGKTACIRTQRALSSERKQYKAVSLPYTEDEDILTVLKLEDLVRNSDEIDREIISSLLHGGTYFSTAEEVSVSESTVKYRIGRLMKMCGFHDRQELLELLRAYSLFL